MSAPGPKPVSLRRMAFAGPAAVLASALVVVLLLILDPKCPAERRVAAVFATGLSAFGVASGLLRRAGGRTLVGLYIGAAAGGVFLIAYWALYGGLNYAFLRDPGTLWTTEGSAAVGGLLAYLGAWMAFGGLYARAEFGRGRLRSGLLAGLRAAVWLPLILIIGACVLGCVPLLGPLAALFVASYAAGYLFFDEIHHLDTLSLTGIRRLTRNVRIDPVTGDTLFRRPEEASGAAAAREGASGSPGEKKAPPDEPSENGEPHGEA
jgi:hypothetical protein